MESWLGVLLNRTLLPAALPLFQSFAQAFTDATPMLEAVKDNYQMWREEAALFTSSQSGSGGPAR
jgi:hypothetical protein